MTLSKRSRRVFTATTAGVLLLTGCAGAPQADSLAGLRAEPAAFVAAEEIPVCEQDGRPASASIAPGSVGLDRSTWSGGSTMSEVRKSGRLVVGVAGDVLLWGSRNPGNGRLEGFDIDVVNRVAAAIGPDVEVEYKVVNFAGRLPALVEGDVQLVAHTMTMTCDRWFGGSTTQDQFINFSSEYYRAGQKVLVRSDSKARSIDDLKDESVCAAKGSTSLENLEKRVTDPVVVNDVGECLVRFQEGEATAITGDDTVLAGFAAQDQYATVVGEAITEVPYGLGIAPADVEFTRFVNAVLERMRSDGTLADLTNKYMAGTGDLPAVPKADYSRDLSKLEARG